jgi:hypothetical protein
MIAKQDLLQEGAEEAECVFCHSETSLASQGIWIQSFHAFNS